MKNQLGFREPFGQKKINRINNLQHFIKKIQMKYGNFQSIISHLAKITVTAHAQMATNYQNTTPKNMKTVKQKLFIILNLKFVKTAQIMMNAANQQMYE